MATETQAYPTGISSRSAANDGIPAITDAQRRNARIPESRWQQPSASRGLLGRVKSIATAPFRRLGKSLICHLGRKYRFQVMFGLLLSQYVAPLVCVAAKLRLADLLRNGPKTISELAELTKANEINLNRVMRALATLQVFRRSTDGKYSLTSLGETLLQDSSESIRDWAIVFGEVMVPTIPGFGESVITGEKAFDTAFGMTLWEFFSKNEPIGHAFDRAMSGITDKQLPGIVAACDLTSSKTVVDIGGGRGALITALLNANPHVQGILYDRPEVTEESQRRIDAGGLRARCKAVSGSFLEWIPKEADTYVIKHVLHDWDDAGVRKIFRNCRDAMAPDDRLLILEMLTEHREFGRDFACKWYDFVQMCGPGGRLRTADEFESLLAECGLKLCHVTPTEVWDVVILEVRRMPVSVSDQ